MYIGIDVGGTNLKYGVLNEYNIMIEKHTEPTNAEQLPYKLIARISEIIKEVNGRFQGIKGVGIGFPGLLTSNGIVIKSPNFPHWNQVSLKTELESLTHTPITVDNDANSAGIAELFDGAGKDLSNFIYITLGTGIGGAIFINGDLFRGETGNAGEIGHTIVDYNDHSQTIDFRKGIIEEYAGKNGIIEYTKKCFVDMGYNSEKYDLSSVKSIAELGVEGCVPSEYSLRNIGYKIGIATINAMHLLDIHHIVIGGAIANSKIIFDSIETTIRKRSLPHISSDFKLLKAKYSEDTGIYGAALMAKFRGR